MAKKTVMMIPTGRGRPIVHATTRSQRASQNLIPQTPPRGPIARIWNNLVG